MKSQVNSSNNKIYSNQEIIQLFDKIKSHFMTKENENERKALIRLSDMCCNDLIRRGKMNNSIFRPLSPHLPIYKPQLTSTFSIFHRISGAFLVTIVLFFYLLCLKIGLICFTYENFYQFFFYSSKLILIAVEITALALSYHLYNGVRHLLTDFSGFIFRKKRLK
jgi:succinate dehydrogenase (ubiquinone) cytochrome b560 subunit